MRLRLIGTSPTSQLILQPFRCFIYAKAHSTTLPQLHLHHRSFYNPSSALPTQQFILKSFRCFTYVIGTSPTSQLILQPFRRFTYVTAHSTAFPLLHLRHMHFTYVTAHSPNLPPLHLRHSLFYNLSADSRTSQVILQTFRCFTYVTGNSHISPGVPSCIEGQNKQSLVD